ncbi:hypothetical protein KFU94_40515 [Chloroflexi bacterium TSY]|nr:hypothetical protein [Chloroflexi bacterium TSY]
MLTRPFLEETLRRQVTAISNVHIADDMKVTGLCINRDGTRITGVHLVSPTELKADLVIDTTGRGSRSPAWLAEVGYTKPEIEEISVKIRYASRLYRRPRQYRTSS